MKEGGALRDSEQSGCDLSTGGLATYRDLRGISAERRDVLVHPMECGDQVAGAVVRAVGIARAEQRLEIHEAEDTEAIGKCDEDDTSPSEAGSVKDGCKGAATGEAAAVDPDKNGVWPFASGRPDVEVEAILAAGNAGIGFLHGLGGELCGVAHAREGLERDGGTKTQRADRRLGEGNAAEDANALLGGAAKAACRGGDDRALGCALSEEAGGRNKGRRSGEGGGVAKQGAAAEGAEHGVGCPFRRGWPIPWYRQAWCRRERRMAGLSTLVGGTALASGETVCPIWVSMKADPYGMTTRKTACR